MSLFFLSQHRLRLMLAPLQCWFYSSVTQARVQERLIPWLVSTGERKAIPLARENTHFLNSGCCPYTEIRWKLQGKYLYPDRTNLSFESNRQFLGKAVEAWTVQNPSEEIPSKNTAKVFDQKFFCIMTIFSLEGHLGCTWVIERQKYCTCVTHYDTGSPSQGKQWTQVLAVSLTISAKASISSHLLFPKWDCSFHLYLLSCGLAILCPWPSLPVLPWPSSLPSTRWLSRNGCDT